MCKITQQVRDLRFWRKLSVRAMENGDYSLAHAYRENAVKCRIRLADLTSGGERYYPNPLTK